jgi:putative transposase
MLLSKKVVFKNDNTSNEILRYMGYSAYKLWNIGNYEKRNYKELGFEKYPNWYDQKKRLKTNFFYKNLPSQTAQDVLKQLEEGWKSFYKLLKTGGLANQNHHVLRKTS